MPAEDAADVRHTVQGHFAGDDPVLCPPRRRRELEAQLGERAEFYVYPGVGHGLRSVFRYTAAAEVAWTRTLAFFAEHLG